MVFFCKMLDIYNDPSILQCPPLACQVFKKLTVTAVLQESQLSAKQTSWISQDIWMGFGSDYS